MFGLGFGEILIILVLALLLLGPSKLPEAAKQLGRGLRDFRKATDDLKQQFEGELYTENRPQRPKLVEPSAAAAPEAAPAVPPGGVPASGAAPPATAENVPGLEAALAEPAAAPQAPASAPGIAGKGA